MKKCTLNNAQQGFFTALRAFFRIKIKNSKYTKIKLAFFLRTMIKYCYETGYSGFDDGSLNGVKLNYFKGGSQR